MASPQPSAPSSAMDLDDPSPSSSSSPLSRGVKRKADESPPITAPRRIQPLAQDVVNKIAAGEIIVAPVHALKELIENAVDAGSTQLDILAKGGGLKLLQITDNGHGIHKDDLPLLCERFTTSKLQTFDDLASIGTYGFRGEALASISHIAHLTVTTRTQDSSCAWRALYADGRLVPAKPGQSTDPKPTAGRHGTQIVVEDLFYNVPTRRRAFRSESEEYAKILDLVGRHAVHCENVAFSCKKFGEASTSISVPAAASTIDRIRQVHGNPVASELIALEAASARWGFKADGYISNANYSVKKTTLLLFINHRSVESTAIRKAIEETYKAFLPKGGHPFVYLSLEIEPHRVDVNVHPTKREVNFLHEDEIIETICDEVRKSLGKVDEGRTFMIQTLLPGSKTPLTNLFTPARSTDSQVGQQAESGSNRKTPGMQTQKPYENNLVRTDSRVQKITSFLPPTAAPRITSGKGAGRSEQIAYEVTDKEPVLCRLASVKELRAEVRDDMYAEFTALFAAHTFVGIVDERRRIAAVQSGVKLYFVDYALLCYEYFYQLGLTDFANFGTIRFDPPLDLEAVLTLAAEQEAAAAPGEDIEWQAVVKSVLDQLLERRDMLAEYFALEISEEGQLLSIPLLVKGYTPSLTKLPSFLLGLGPRVNWYEEKACFQTFLQQLARFYKPEPLPPPPTPLGEGEEAVVEDEEIAKRREHVRAALEEVLFPAFRARLVPTGALREGVLEVASLKGLYRVFERC
ncbi:DNA mismatch repair protein MutL [Trichodelitschia bisporula]|uniref:DNA mismatch repair protein MutL n=1 Tax=Trichodelitschia bisporula TaxID=703511 RepID=A0A6G1HLC3_9PEZI|nr:DNA mismatch repair protein MutL [Trichodelitschia bisporula]